jgi:6-phosphogluconate dehydrogenase
LNAQCEIGVVGLGVMGRNLALNIAEHGHRVAGYDKDPERVLAFRNEAAGIEIRGAKEPKEFAESLQAPRSVIVLVPAGPIVDSVIEDLLPHLTPGDLLIDGGNTYFKDTDLRISALKEKGLLYLGLGISGGEEGARHGASLMAGGEKAAYERVRPILESIAAKAEGEPCVDYMGQGSAGHYVKMVHNGIEYGLMQLIAESYDLMKRGLGLGNDELQSVYERWNRTELESYLIEITAHIFAKEDPRTDRRVIDVIRDSASQKGTGRWTAQEGMELGVPAPIIDTAVSMRNLSSQDALRATMPGFLGESHRPHAHSSAEALEHLRRALHAAMILTYAQGFEILGKASGEYDFAIDLGRVARVWRGGCIIRALLLRDILAFYKRDPALASLLLDEKLGQTVAAQRGDLAVVVRSAADLGIPAPAFAAALGYLDARRSAWLPANLIQAQRNYFGAHAYERVDAKGKFHTEWKQPEV